VQPFSFRFACFQFATLGVVEALLGDDDDAKNALCPPITYWSKNSDVLSSFVATAAHEVGLRQYPEIRNWARQSRLNPMGGLDALADDPVVTAARATIRERGSQAFQVAMRLLADGV
jgi:hypothetical protein